MAQTQEDFLEPVIERGQRFVDGFARRYFRKATLEEVISHLAKESRLGEFPQLTGVVRERMQEFLGGFELSTPARYPNAEVD